MKLRITIWLGLSLAVAIYAGCLISVFQAAEFGVVPIQYPVLAESQPPNPMTI